VDTLERVREQISGIVDGQIVPATNAPLLTSAHTVWSGFLLETHAACGRQDICWGWHRTHVSLFTKGQLSFRVHNPRGDQEFVARPGSVCVFPGGFDETHFAIAGSDFQAIVVELDPARVQQLLGHKRLVALAPKIVAQDEYIAILLRKMASEVVQGCPRRALYGHLLSLELAAYLAATSPLRRRRKNTFGKLAPSETRQVADYIHANLDCELSLFDLAQIAQLSPRQFVRAFSKTFGSTPHQYVIKQRVARATDLLLKGHRLVEIAGVVGFASQSHLTNVFQKITGTPPGRFRREHRLH
jgi:AraC family transcriptional regulator